jgi:hypothetical protein
VLMQTPFNEGREQLSPDGQWLAYESDESGRPEVYIASFQGQAGKWQISTNGGVQPRWAHTGRELFYIAADSRLMSVAITAGETLSPGVPNGLFHVRFDDFPRNAYCVAPDDQRFLFQLPLDELTTPITVVMNWHTGMGKK